MAAAARVVELEALKEQGPLTGDQEAELAELRPKAQQWQKKKEEDAKRHRARMAAAARVAELAGQETVARDETAAQARSGQAMSGQAGSVVGDAQPGATVSSATDTLRGEAVRRGPQSTPLLLRPSGSRWRGQGEGSAGVPVGVSAAVPVGVSVDAVRVLVPGDVVAGGGLVEFVRGGVADSGGGPVLLVSQGNSGAGVVVSSGQGSALARGVGRDVVALVPGPGGRGSQWTVFGADGSARPVGWRRPRWT
ncbi:hypothetical protein [Saccharopolyspora spinosa]|uniref:hypothetical protein n=1 Tax=Saccharopolyspora spinosa TaxID=60894 RepID=UPI0004984B01|nr:hypothetical protein [Saccharopolyspora spinosa]